MQRVADAPSVIRHDERRAASGLPTGSRGLEAFHDPGAWIGFLELEPGSASGWHHHGAWTSYAVVQRGVLRWEYGEDGSKAIEVRAGDVGRMPAEMIHRDVSAGDVPLVLTLFRAGEGPLTIDVDRPQERRR